MTNEDLSIARSADSRAERQAQRIADLMANDFQFRDAGSLPSVNEAKTRPGLGLAEIAATVMEGYADRPALGQRARELVADSTTGRTTIRLLPQFETITYRELWARARALAAVWHHDPAARVGAGDLVCILAFAGIDYVVTDLAIIHLGAVSVPLQINAPVAQLGAIVAETEPRWIATSIDCLNIAVDIILAGQRPANVLVFDYQSGDDTQREIYQAALQRLADAGCPVPVHTLGELCERGAKLAPAPLFSNPEDENRLAAIYYTSGSTGLPKGAMYPERMVKDRWLVRYPTSLICVHYMPMNHSFGPSTLCMTLGNGGTCYFTAKSDLSTLFEDIRLVRPTDIRLVPRICEMIHQHFQGELDHRNGANADRAALEKDVMAELRRDLLGGRVLSAMCGSAPLTSELRAFIEACTDVELREAYGCTEVGGVTQNGRVMRPSVIDYRLVDVPELGYFRTDKPYPRGELLVKTSNIMTGYYKRPELTAAMFDGEGYYKTGDIMAEIGPDQIAYVDRRNNVLKLAQGEFVAIARLEALFTSGHSLIHQVYLYGTSERDFLIAVVVPRLDVAAQSGLDGDEAALRAALRDAIKHIAQAEQLNAYEVPRDFLIETEPFSVENGLLAGLGKYARPALKTCYGPRLEKLYADIAKAQADELSVLRHTDRNAPVLQTVARALEATLGIDHVDPNQNASFAELGGDSLASLSFSLLLEEIFEIEVPVGVITNPASNLRQLACFIEKARDDSSTRPTFASIHGRGATEIHARDLTLDKFIDAQTLAKAESLAAPAGPAKTVLLTGANGYLGRFLCLGWLEKLAKSGGSLICIARGKDNAAARQRVAEVFDSGDPRLLRHFNELASGHLEVLAGDIGEPNLGLDEATWNRLAETADLIVHPAALVNHILPYSQLFGPNVVGTAELIRLALTTRLKPFINVSSVAAAMAGGGRHADEDADIRDACPSRSLTDAGYASGYASSKWAAEVLLREAHDRYDLPIAVFRSDMILAHRRYVGQINVPDMFTRLLYSLVVTGLAPRSFYRASPGSVSRAHYDGLPVDFTAEAIIEIGSREWSGYRTYHVCNPHDDGVSLDSFVDWLIGAGCAIQRIDDYQDWLLRFETALRALPEAQRQQSSLALLHQMSQPMPAVAGCMVPAERFHAAVRELGIGPEGDIPHLSAEFIGKYLHDLRQLRLL